MVTVCASSCLALVALVPGVNGPAVVAGMLGPLIAASATWVVVVRTVRTSPAQLTAVMMLAFAVKVIFFAAYVVVAIRALRLPPVPFMTAFTGYFVGLYVAEALLFHRLFTRRAGALS